MAKKSLMLVVVIILQLSFFSSFAQTRFSVSIGAANPLGTFGSVDASDDYSNYAAMGAVLGVKVAHQFQESRFGVYGSVDFIYNGLAKERVEELDDFYSLFNIAKENYLYPRFLNFPLALGVLYHYEINENVSLMGNWV